MDSKYIVEKINNLNSSISHVFYQHHMNTEYNDNYIEEYPGQTEFWLEQAICDLYYLILAFFEVKELRLSYELFKSKFNSLVENKKDLLTKNQYYPEEEMELKIPHDFFIHLNPFLEFSNKKMINDEILKVHSILNNTNHILKKLNTEVNGEADIYKAVKWVLGLYFYKVRSKNTATFIQEYKTYHPDILIPELKTAIEYKYIRTEDDESKIETYIDEIKIDSVNYDGDYRYDNFIAVVYLKNNILTTPEKIEECWKSKSFPKEWKLIITSN